MPRMFPIKTPADGPDFFREHDRNIAGRQRAINVDSWVVPFLHISLPTNACNTRHRNVDLAVIIEETRLEEVVEEVKLAHPLRVVAIAVAKVKTAMVDRSGHHYWTGRSAYTRSSRGEHQEAGRARKPTDPRM